MILSLPGIFWQKVFSCIYGELVLYKRSPFRHIYSQKHTQKILWALFCVYPLLLNFIIRDSNILQDSKTLKVSNMV